jgi:predicted  nucleic acid-binding Zn-ribbon protein
MLERMQLVDIGLDDTDGGPASTPCDIEDTHDILNRKIQELEEIIRDLETKLESAEGEKVASYERETQLVAKINVLEDEIADLKEEMQNFDSNMTKFKRVSDVAWQEFEDLKESYECAMRLKDEAERYAHQMLAERDALARGSAVLMASAISDERLTTALTAVEELSAKLANEQREHEGQLETLKKQLNSSSLDKQISELEKQLSLAVSENERLTKAITDLENWKQKLEKENVDLVNKLDVAEQKLRPPPPPPPPPPALFSPLRLLIKKQPKSGGTPAKSKANSPRDQSYEEALKEMMERIKSGRALKPTTEATTTIDKPDGSSSAIDNLHNLLAQRNCTIQETIDRQKLQRQAAPTAVGGADSELMNAFRKIRPKAEQLNT